MVTGVEVELGQILDIPDDGVQASGQIVQWLSDKIANTSQPTTRFGIQLQLPLLNKYGCWCYRGTDYPGGRGTTQDDYDEACKAMHMGYDCVVSDAPIMEDNCMANPADCCNPVDTDYLWFIKPAVGLPGSYTFECAEDVQQDWCRARVCQIDLRFVATFFELITFGIYPDRVNLGHIGVDNGEFDPTTCPDAALSFDYTDFVTVDTPSSQDGAGVGGGTVATTTQETQSTTAVTSERVCCGDYPFRSWFNKFSNDDRACCEYEDALITAKYRYQLNVGQMYHSNLAICCADGVVSGSTVCQKKKRSRVFSPFCVVVVFKKLSINSSENAVHVFRAIF